MYNTKKTSKLQWVKDHSFELSAGAIFLALIATVTLVSVKEQEAILEEEKKHDDWYKQQLSQGHTIIEQDGYLVAVDVKSVY